MDKVQKYNSFNTNTPSSESYRNYRFLWFDHEEKPQSMEQASFTEFCDVKDVT
jgi:hypothetical protein